MTVIKNIPTEYNGIQFRSRLEARWAVFLDSLGIEWRYEYEGYQLPSGWYLPDFWLPHAEVFIEIKGAYPTGLEQKFATELGEATEKQVVIMNGDIGRWAGTDYSDYECGHQFYPHWDNGYAPTLCFKCGAFGFVYECRTPRIRNHRRCCFTHGDDRFHNFDDPRMLRAIRIANNFQFQFRHRR